MKISVFADSVQRDQALARFIVERTMLSLERHRDAIQRVEIRIRDINGARGGIDKECKIYLTTPHGTPLIVTSTHLHPGQAFRAALKRLVPNLRDALSRSSVRTRKTRRIIRSRKAAA